MAQAGRLLRQNDEHRLRNFFGLMRVADLPGRDGINQVDALRHQRGKGLIRTIFGVLAQ